MGSRQISLPVTCSTHITTPPPVDLQPARSMPESFAATKMRPRSMVGIEYWCVPVLISHNGSVLPGSAGRFRAAETMLGLEVPPQRNDAAEPSATDAARSGHAGSSDTKTTIP